MGQEKVYLKFLTGCLSSFQVFSFKNVEINLYLKMLLFLNVKTSYHLFYIEIFPLLFNFFKYFS